MALYRVQNTLVATTVTATAAPITTNTSLYTSLQIIGDTNVGIKIVEWGVSFNGSVLASGFPCELVDTGTTHATVTTYAAADIMGYDAAGQSQQAQSGTSTGIPLELGTALSGVTSSAEGSATTILIHDSALVEPIGCYFKQFPLGREPFLTPGNFMRIRIKGDGTTTHYSYLVFEV